MYAPWLSLSRRRAQASVGAATATSATMGTSITMAIDVIMAMDTDITIDLAISSAFHITAIGHTTIIATATLVTIAIPNRPTYSRPSNIYSQIPFMLLHRQSSNIRARLRHSYRRAAE